MIDADYRGQVKVLLFNHAETEFKIKVGDRIAQLVLERVCFQTLKLPQLCAHRKLTPASRFTHRKSLKWSS